jgi:hypothetical protein
MLRISHRLKQRRKRSQQIAFQFRIIIQSALYYIKNDKIETPDERRVPEFSEL